MKRYITNDDFKDLLIKGFQRGFPFVLSKFHFSKKHRTKTAFDKTRLNGISCWDIPMIQKRWNMLISEKENIDNIDFIRDEVLKEKKGIHLLSVGSGMCKKEIRLAESKRFERIVCIDFSRDSVNYAIKVIAKKN